MFNYANPHPPEAQRQRVQAGKEEQRNERGMTWLKIAILTKQILSLDFALLSIRANGIPSYLMLIVNIFINRQQIGVCIDELVCST